MSLSLFSDARRLEAARKIIKHLAELLDIPLSVRLWDGSLVPLGREAGPEFALSISGPGVAGAILRWPTLENLLLHYASGQIDFHGGDLIEFVERLREGRPKTRLRLRSLNKKLLFREALPLFFARRTHASAAREFEGDASGREEWRRQNKKLIQFHYDLGNEFYALFLDPEMQYSCGYFTDWGNTLEQGQHDKLEMICRKLRLAPGETLLDIGCGWGGLICYAARHFGVTAHGVTLSEEQFSFANNKIQSLGLGDRVKVELRDYSSLEGTYDKIASIGMYEHVGIANYQAYFSKVRSLLRDRGIFLNHGITRRAKKSKSRFRKITPEKRMILKYIFPGSELDHIGHTVECLEANGFEVHDVEGWREHYALTTRHWCQRLSARREEAIQLVGSERYRMWVAYLAAVSFGFADGSLRIYQTVATKHRAKGPSGMPPTREDLYEE
jgi:cyclopropane-fatty-acyl-phospholipid synthase